MVSYRITELYNINRVRQIIVGMHKILQKEKQGYIPFGKQINSAEYSGEL
jgi:hypothetical protein